MREAEFITMGYYNTTWNNNTVKTREELDTWLVKLDMDRIRLINYED